MLCLTAIMLSLIDAEFLHFYIVLLTAIMLSFIDAEFLQY
jgi:hypothetical protein